MREEARDENCGRLMMSRGCTGAGGKMMWCRMIQVHGTSVVYSVWKKLQETRRHEVCRSVQQRDQSHLKSTLCHYTSAWLPHTPQEDAITDLTPSIRKDT